MTFLLKCLHLCNVKQAKLQFSNNYFSKIPPLFPEFCSLLLASYFSKKFAGKIGTAPNKFLLIYYYYFLPQFLCEKIITHATAICSNDKDITHSTSTTTVATLHHNNTCNNINTLAHMSQQDNSISILHVTMGSAGSQSSYFCFVMHRFKLTFITVMSYLATQ